MGGSFHWIGGDPHRSDWSVSDQLGVSLCWSGTLADEFFAGDVRNWTKPGRELLQSWLDRTLAQLTPGRQLAIVPHHAHLLSDVAGQMRLWHDRSGTGLATVLYPSGLIAPTMLADVHDHLTRSITNLAPRCALCILEDIAPDSSNTEGSPQFQRVPWGSGILPHRHMERLLAEHLPSTTPILIQPNQPFFR